MWRCTVRLDWWQRARARAGQHAWSGPAEFAANPLAAGTDFCCARPGPSAASFVWIVMLFFVAPRSHSLFVQQQHIVQSTHTHPHTLTCSACHTVSSPFARAGSHTGCVPLRIPCPPGARPAQPADAPAAMAVSAAWAGCPLMPVPPALPPPAPPPLGASGSTPTPAWGAAPRCSPWELSAPARRGQASRTTGTCCV